MSAAGPGPNRRAGRPQRLPWCAFEVALFRDPTFRRLSWQAKLLFFAGRAHCSENLTDGLVQAEDLALVAAEAGVGPEHATELTRSGLWRRSDEGYHDERFGRTNPKAEVRVKAWKRDRDRKGLSGEFPYGNPAGIPAGIPAGNPNGNSEYPVGTPAGIPAGTLKKTDNREQITEKRETEHRPPSARAYALSVVPPPGGTLRNGRSNDLSTNEPYVRDRALEQANAAQLREVADRLRVHDETGHTLGTLGREAAEYHLPMNEVLEIFTARLKLPGGQGGYIALRRARKDVLQHFGLPTHGRRRKSGELTQ